ncbi:MAG TPA: sensor domain-containing protein [Solirubrobacteraceae bacterium]|nr:sensor domain-containing protein [Solirubrobacteraceae bacterium]
MNRSHSIFTAAGRDLAYLLVVLATSVVEFAVWVTGVSVSASLLVLVIGVVVWLATAWTFRWAAGVDRRTAGWYRRRPIRADYREPIDGTWLVRARTVTTDPRTWKDLGWLIINSTVGFVLATTALTVTTLVISYLTMPLWWWAINDPSKQYATLNLGIYTITSTSLAFATAGLGLMLVPVAALINRGAAAGHARMAARLLGPSRTTEAHRVTLPAAAWPGPGR